MARTRKLFPSYGSALAAQLLATLERERIVQRFVSEYVSAYNRAGILGGPARDRELAQTIGREIILVAVHEAGKSLPRYMGKKVTKLDPDEKLVIDALLLELTETLGRAWRWTADDRSQFHQDLERYSDSAPVSANGNRKVARMSRVAEEEDPPFVGRVALLLDPSMIDQARRAAKKFHDDVVRLSRKALRHTLGPGNA
jgi:hypothetical protein